MSRLDEVALETSLANLNVCLDWAIAFVVIGLILEYSPKFWSRLTRVFSERFIEKTGEVLVIVGVAGELGMHVWSAQMEDKIKSAQRNKIIALETRLAARSITDDQAHKLASQLKSYGAQTYQIIPYWKNPESFALANGISHALTDAGWKLENPERFTTMVGVITGVVVNIAKGAPPEARKAASELAKVLNEEDIVSVVEEVDDPENSPRINMQIGIKP